MKRMRISSFALCLALLLSTLFTFSGCKETPTPASRLDDILEATFGGASSSSWSDKTSACVEILFRPTDDLPLEGLGDVCLTMFSEQSGNSVLQLRADLSEYTLDLDAYAKADTLILASSLVGDTAYGMSYAELETMLEGLMSGGMLPDFGYGMGGEAAGDFFSDKDHITFEDLTGVEGTLDYSELENASSIVEISASSALATILASLGTKENLQTLSELVERYLDVLKSSLNKDLETSVKYDDKGTTVSFTFNNDCAKKLIKTLFEEMQEDDELREFLAGLVESIAPEMAELLMQQYDVFLGNEAVLFDLFEALDASPFNVTVSISAGADNVMNGAKLVLDTTDEGERNRVTLLFDASDKSKLEISFKEETYDASAKAFDLSVKTGLTYEVAENTAEYYDATLRFFYVTDDTSVDLKLLQIFYEKETGDYELFVPLSKLPLGIAQDFVLKGNYQSSPTETTLTVTELSAPKIGTVALDLTIKVTYNVELPQAPAEYRDIALMTEDDFEALMATIMEHPVVQLLLSAAPSDANALTFTEIE